MKPYSITSCINSIAINMNMNILNIYRFTSLFFCLVLMIPALAQDRQEMEEEFDDIVEEWLTSSELLSAYDGVNEYCQNPQFRQSVNNVLDDMHHYDSLIMLKMNDPLAASSMDYKEQRKTLKDIYKMEFEYGTKGFVGQMREACLFRNEIEDNADRLRNGMGPESYDAKVLLLETQVQRYLNHIDKLAVKINDHLHYLYIVD